MGQLTTRIVHEAQKQPRPCSVCQILLGQLVVHTYAPKLVKTTHFSILTGGFAMSAQQLGLSTRGPNCRVSKSSTIPPLNQLPFTLIMFRLPMSAAAALARRSCVGSAQLISARSRATALPSQQLAQRSFAAHTINGTATAQAVCDEVAAAVRLMQPELGRQPGLATVLVRWVHRGVDVG